MKTSALAPLGSLTPEGGYTPPQLRPPALPDVPAGMAMDREFVLRHQILERYLTGKLPLKGTQDFERFCRENPGVLEELRFADRVEAGLKLLDRSGTPLPWEERPRQLWEKLPFIATSAALALIFGIASLVLASKLSSRSHALADATARALSQPLDPATSTRTLVVVPSRTAPSLRSVATLGGAGAQMADLKVDLSWSHFNVFRVTIDRVDQGRVAVLGHVLRDSNGQLRLSFNTTALGPGDYQFAFDGVSLHGDLTPQAWVTLAVAPHSAG